MAARLIKPGFLTSFSSSSTSSNFFPISSTLCIRDWAAFWYCSVKAWRCCSSFSSISRRRLSFSSLCLASICSNFSFFSMAAWVLSIFSSSLLFSSSCLSTNLDSFFIILRFSSFLFCMSRNWFWICWFSCKNCSLSLCACCIFASIMLFIWSLWTRRSLSICSRNFFLSSFCLSLNISICIKMHDNFNNSVPKRNG